jgi:Arc/MetJ-type ribon-helix-helix transcriptional regulator
MTVTLTPEQMRWIEAAVAAGQFPSVEDAVRAAVDELMATAEFGDLEWAKPYIDQARESVARGDVIDGDEFLTWLDERKKAPRSR